MSIYGNSNEIKNKYCLRCFKKLIGLEQEDKYFCSEECFNIVYFWNNDQIKEAKEKRTKLQGF